MRVYWASYNGERFGLMFTCPGCDMAHCVHVKVVPEINRGSVWKWNGSEDRPTFSPSLLVRFPYGDPPKDVVCHSFVRDGRIQFLADSTHHLAGQTVDLPEIQP